MTYRYMRYDDPDELVDAARETLGFTSKTDTVVYALREVVRRGRRDELKDLLDRVTFEFDPADVRQQDGGAVASLTRLRSRAPPADARRPRRRSNR